jgi:hypothetical protein
MRTKEVETMTIFSLVQPERLASFFDIVATALRTQEEEEAEDSTAKEALEDTTSPDAETIDASVKKGDSSSSASDATTTTTTLDGTVSIVGGDATITSRSSDYAAITVPCIDFPARKKQQMDAAAAASSEPVKKLEPLFVTVRKSL